MDASTEVSRLPLCLARWQLRAMSDLKPRSVLCLDVAFQGNDAHGVDETTAPLPEGWRARLVPVCNENTRGATGWCLEVHDLAVSKLAAGREKDVEYLAALFRHALARQRWRVSDWGRRLFPPTSGGNWRRRGWRDGPARHEVSVGQTCQREAGF